MTTIADVERVQAAVKERATRWMPVVVALHGAETMALQRVLSASVYKHPYTGNDARDKRKAALKSFKNTFVETMPASRLVNYLFSGFGAGFDYFRAIYNHAHGGHQQTVFRPQYAAAPEVSAASEIQNRFERTLVEVGRNLDSLKQAMGSKNAYLPSDHLRNAFSVMLLSPILYPPTEKPKAETLALLMEWHMWLHYLPYVLEQVRLDVSRKRARMEPLVDLEPMFVRLKYLIEKSGSAIQVPSQMANLDSFRKDCEDGRITENNLNVLSPLAYTLAVKFPPAVKKWIAAEGDSARDIVRNASMYTSTYEARI